MKITSFDPAKDLILVMARIRGPLGETQCRLALDTAASETLVVPDVLDSLGYSPRDAAEVTSVISVIGRETGYRLRVECLAALGFELSDFFVNAYDLPEGAGLDGLLGLNFLRNFNYEIRSKEGLIRVEPA